MFPPNAGVPDKLPAAREIVVPEFIVRFEPMVNVPLVNVRVPLTLAAVFSATPLVLLIVRSPNVLVPEPAIDCALAPLNVTVELPPANVPFALKEDPATEKL